MITGRLTKMKGQWAVKSSLKATADTIGSVINQQGGKLRQSLSEQA